MSPAAAGVTFAGHRGALSLILFLVIYVGLTALAAYGVYWSFQQAVNPTMAGGRVGRVRSDPWLYFLGLGLACGILFLFLFKSFFQRSQRTRLSMSRYSRRINPDSSIYLRPVPKRPVAPPCRYRVFVSHEVNACVFYDQSFWSLFFPTKKNLLIGLKLVNRLNLSEFKAVLAHESRAFLAKFDAAWGGYVYTANMTALVYGRDWLDDLIDGLMHFEARIALFAWTIKAVPSGCCERFWSCFSRSSILPTLSMQRKMEFNADLVAYSVTGSDAIVHALAKLDFAGEALLVAGNDLFHAGDHGLFTRDLFYHQTKSLEFLRKRYKDPQKGEPPPLPADPSDPGQVFQPGDLGIPLMWATHPSNYDRERNVKQHYVRSTIDDRPSWLVFENAEDLRAAVTQRYYEIAQQIPEPKMVDADKVQAFIDTEHHETTFDEKYHGMYDAGVISPGDLAGTLRVPRPISEFAEGRSPGDQRTPAFFTTGHAARYQEFVERQKDFNLSCQRRQRASRKTATFKIPQRGTSPAKQGEKLHSIKCPKELETGSENGSKEPRRPVFKTHFAMARQIGRELLAEFQARYEFHLADAKTWSCDVTERA